MSLDLYKPLEEWYLHDPEGIHGLSHAARVLVWAHLIGDWIVKQGTTIDLEVVHWAATLLDIRRINDGIDFSHGERAANWIRANYQRIPYPLTEMQLESLAYCCTW